MILVDGIGISRYRSFGKSLQLIGPFSKINLFIGRNNCGKSNILLFLKNHYAQLLSSIVHTAPQIQYAGVDRHKGEDDELVVFAIAVARDGSRREKLLESVYPHNKPRDNTLELILDSQALTQGTEASWFVYEAPRAGGKLTLSKSVVQELVDENVIPLDRWSQWSQMFIHQSGGSLAGNWIPEVLWRLSPNEAPPAPVVLVHAIRSVGDPGSIAASDFSGGSFFEKLLQLQNPAYDKGEDSQRFDNIVAFVRTVTGNQQAKLQVPHTRDTINVTIDGKPLPLSNIGTGIHEVIILAIAATLHSKRIVCIEEPELHLHPSLQKALVRYLVDKTDNQYFISTHSAHLLDTEGAAIFHVRYAKGETHVDPAYTATHKSQICCDLGYRASDLLQSNCIIWVEGPSDRVYLNHWIHTLDAKLTEGIDYSVMSYAGKLLSHLSANDPEAADEFISLRRLNRNMVVVMDSDRKSEDDAVNKAKERVSAELKEGPGFAWVTQGREIENYIDTDVLLAAMKAVHPHAERLAGKGQYGKMAYYYVKEDGEVREADKVKLSLEVVKSPAKLDVLDLKERVNDLVKFINESNGFA